MTQLESNDRTNEFTPGRFDETSPLASEPTDTTMIFGAQRPADNTVSFEAPTQFVASTPQADEQGTVALGGPAFAEPKHDSTLTFSEEETAYLRAQGETTASQIPQDDAWTAPIQPGTVGSSKRGSALRGLAAVSLGVVAAAAIASAVYFRGGFDGAASTADSQTDGAAVEIAAPADITSGDETVAVAPAIDQPAQVAAETAPAATTDQPSGPVASAETVPPAASADTASDADAGADRAASGTDIAAAPEVKETEPTIAVTDATDATDTEATTAAADSASQADQAVTTTAASKTSGETAASQATASQAAAADRDASKGDRQNRGGDSKNAAESAQIASTAVDTSVSAATAVADTTTNIVIRAHNGDRSAPVVPTLPKLPAFGRH